MARTSKAPLSTSLSTRCAAAAAAYASLLCLGSPVATLPREVPLLRSLWLRLHSSIEFRQTGSVKEMAASRR